MSETNTGLASNLRLFSETEWPYFSEKTILKSVESWFSGLSCPQQKSNLGSREQTAEFQVRAYPGSLDNENVKIRFFFLRLDKDT